MKLTVLESGPKVAKEDGKQLWVRAKAEDLSTVRIGFLLTFLAVVFPFGPVWTGGCAKKMYGENNKKQKKGPLQKQIPKASGRG
jgi:hypothetical protein